jgi:hypothetical protein
LDSAELIERLDAAGDVCAGTVDIIPCSAGAVAVGEEDELALALDAGILRADMTADEVKGA